MPQYEYDCMRCAKRYTKTRSMNDKDPGYNCDECGQNLVRVYGSAGIIFNGSGFYKTDNRKV